MNETLKHAGADPYLPVAFEAARGCYEHFLYGDAVDILKRLAEADPEDDDSRNLLAWIRATCPDASFRNGKEAVEAATAACEISNWRNWDWIDTLAAAYAESGDFKSAVKFQKEALQTGHPPEAIRREMEAHLALYQQSQPLRETPKPDKQ